MNWLFKEVFFLWCKKTWQERNRLSVSITFCCGCFSFWIRWKLGIKFPKLHYEVVSVAIFSFTNRVASLIRFFNYFCLMFNNITMQCRCKNTSHYHCHCVKMCHLLILMMYEVRRIIVYCHRSTDIMLSQQYKTMWICLGHSDMCNHRT